MTLITLGYGLNPSASFHSRRNKGTNTRRYPTSGDEAGIGLHPLPLTHLALHLISCSLHALNCSPGVGSNATAGFHHRMPL
ncbi:hypothetical protein E2562_029993 [Oryza meyeriana var. granulata]|uniref:Uncharacterized protein n=1 Tax=Oryza meyeriana var. granulata TaxID=110450 RepID=A0A6G1ER65_9ORYZ|nr:hypothetical protein E2562_029993 [Oryza meyeriana var. granulata]